MKINSTIFFTIASLFYSTLLMIAYFSKDKIKTPENKVYSKLIIVNFIGIILEIFCTIFTGYAKDNLIYYTILNKMFLVYLVVWCSVFGIYVFLISSKKEDKALKKYMKSVINKYLIFDVVLALLIFILPVEFKYNNYGYVMYSYGKATKIVYISSFISIGLMIACLIKNFKNIKNKKYLPIYIYLLFGTLTTIIQNRIPELLLATTMETFVTIIMYFTIENPDKKLLEAIHKSKKTANDANLEKSMLVYNMMSEVKQIATDVNRYSNIILNSTNLEETKFFAREIIAANSRLYTMSNKIYNIDEIEVKKIKTINTKYNIKLAGIFHKVQNFGNGGFAEFLGGFHLQQAGHVHAAADDLVAGLHVAGQALAGQGGGVQGGGALYDHTVNGHPLAGLHHDHGADLHVIGVHLLQLAVLAFHVGVVRADVHQAGNALAALAHGHALEQLADLVEDDNGTALHIIAQRKRAHGGNGHQEALVKGLTVLDAKQCLAQHVPADHQIRDAVQYQLHRRGELGQKLEDEHQNQRNDDALQVLFLLFVHTKLSFCGIHGPHHAAAGGDFNNFSP